MICVIVCSDANKTLHDTNDDLREALETTRTATKRPRSAVCLIHIIIIKIKIIIILKYQHGDYDIAVVVILRYLTVGIYRILFLCLRVSPHSYVFGTRGLFPGFDSLEIYLVFFGFCLSL